MAGLDFLQLMLQQAHPLLTLKNITTVDIPKYSSFQNLFKYAKEVKHYVSNHGLKNRFFTEKEITETFLMHLDDPHFHAAIEHYKTTICLSPAYFDTIYKVPNIVSTIESWLLIHVNQLGRDQTADQTTKEDHNLGTIILVL